MEHPLRGPRRAIVVLPSGFTIGNLFFGFFAIIAATRRDFTQAGWYVVLGGVMDAFDGRVARATRTGSRFGEELDSLVDAISFGLAPALIVYFAVLNPDGWDWIWAFLFTACAVIRLARFNVEQAGSAKTHFHGLALSTAKYMISAGARPKEIASTSESSSSPSRLPVPVARAIRPSNMSHTPPRTV